MKCGGGGGNLGMDRHPMHGEVIIFLVASCYRETGIFSQVWTNRLVSSTDFTFLSSELCKPPKALQEN